MVFGEVIQLRAFEIDDADDFPFVLERNRQLRSGFRMDADIAAIGQHIADANRHVHQSRRADQAIPEGNGNFFHLAFIGAHDGLEMQDARAFIQLKDGEDVVVHGRFDCCRDATEDFVDFERRRHIEAHFVKHRQHFAVVPFAFVDVRVVDRDGDLAG